MIESSPNGQSSRIVVDQLMAFPPQVIERVHNFGTRIVVVPRGVDPEKAARSLRLGQDSVEDLQADTGGLYDSLTNRIFVREDMLSEGFSAPLSTAIVRHEFVHAFEDSMAKYLRTQQNPPLHRLYDDAIHGRGGRPVSSYARTNKAEYIAEAGAAYVTPRNELKRGWFHRALFGTCLAFSGFGAPTRDKLHRRDPRLERAIGDMFKAAAFPQFAIQRRREDESREAWLWRVHQLRPDDTAVKLDLLEYRLARAGNPAVAQQVEESAAPLRQAREAELREAWLKEPKTAHRLYDLISFYAEPPVTRQADHEAAEGKIMALLREDLQQGHDSARYDFLDQELRRLGMKHAATEARALLGMHMIKPFGVG